MVVFVLLALILFILFTENVTSIAFLLSLLTMFLYVIPYFTLLDTFVKLDFLSDKQIDDFFLYITLCYGAFVIGHRVYSPDNIAHRQQLAQSQRMITDTVKFEKYSIYAGIVGLMGYGFFIIHSGAGYFQGHQTGDFSVGGYIYELRFFIFSAVLLLYNAYLNKTLSGKGLQFLIGISIFLTIDAYLQQQRGSWIRFGVIFMISFLFYKNRFRPVTVFTLFERYKPVFIIGLFLWMLLTFTVQLRKFYGPDVSLVEQVSSTVNLIIEEPDVLFGGSGIHEGNEFVTSYNAFSTNEKVKVYDYGYKWLYGFINFVPRVLWKNKPRLYTFSTNEFDLIEKYGTRKNPIGAVLTGMIDAYYRFGWLAPLVFFTMGYYVKKLYIASTYDVRFRFFYICLYIGCFFFITQDMFPLVAFTLEMYIPIFVVSLLSFRFKPAARLAHPAANRSYS